MNVIFRQLLQTQQRPPDTLLTVTVQRASNLTNNRQTHTFITKFLPTGQEAGGLEEAGNTGAGTGTGTGVSAPRCVEAVAILQGNTVAGVTTTLPNPSKVSGAVLWCSSQLSVPTHNTTLASTVLSFLPPLVEVL